MCRVQMLESKYHMHFTLRNSYHAIVSKKRTRVPTFFSTCVDLDQDLKRFSPQIRYHPIKTISNLKEKKNYFQPCYLCKIENPIWQQDNAVAMQLLFPKA
jgi:hypothetical protein